MADAAQASAPKPRKPSTYLILYNFLSAILWTVVLGRTVAVCVTRGPAFVVFSVGEWTRWTQTLAGMEVLHSLFGASPISPNLL